MFLKLVWFVVIIYLLCCMVLFGMVFFEYDYGLFCLLVGVELKVGGNEDLFW